jgi:hypothetical protein
VKTERQRILRATAAAQGHEELWRSLRSKVAVRQVSGIHLLEIAVTYTEPAGAKLIAEEPAPQPEEAVTASPPFPSSPLARTG